MLGADGRVEQTRVAAWLCLFPVFSGPQVAHLHRRFVNDPCVRSTQQPLESGASLAVCAVVRIVGVPRRDR